jgi:cation diffusion facilitator CzcD-associated flavoprotein CzcO
MQEGKIPTIIIIGAGPGGLVLYHALIKNKDKKEFNVKIFEREASPAGNSNYLFFFFFILFILLYFIFFLTFSRQ